MPTVSIHMPEQTGQTGLSLFLRKTSDGNLLNVGGDALTEAPASSGRFTADVAETIAEVVAASVVKGGLTVRDGWVNSGGSLVVDGYPIITVGAMQADTLTEAALAADAVTAVKTGLSLETTAQAAKTAAEAVNTKLTTGRLASIDRITSTVSTLWANLTAMITGSEASAKFTAIALENAPAGGGGGLTGPYNYTLTVTDADTSAAIQNATVRLYRTGETGTVATNAIGVALFTVEAATWTYAVIANGYAGATGTIVVTGDGNTAVQLTADVVSLPDDPALCAVTIAVKDQYGAALAGEPVEITFVKYADAATTTLPVLSVPPVQTTNASGVVQVELLRQATYKIVYGQSGYARRVDVAVPNAATLTVEI